MTMKKVLVLVGVWTIGTYLSGFFSGSLWGLLILSAIGGTCLGHLVARVQSLIEEVEDLRRKLAAAEAAADAHTVVNNAMLEATSRTMRGDK